MADATDVAQWMVAQLDKHQHLYQEDAVTGIDREFGTGFTYFNANGTRVILRIVLNEFRRLTEGSVVWESSEKMWRKLEPGEESEGRLVE
jgi:hypothetical protein